jgi:hypothetical protein
MEKETTFHAELLPSTIRIANAGIERTAPIK